MVYQVYCTFAASMYMYIHVHMHKVSNPVG